MAVNTKFYHAKVQLIRITEVQFEDLTKIPRKLHRLWKKCPSRHTTNTVNACEGYSNLSKTRDFCNFHWIIQHCLPDTLHFAGEKDMSFLQSRLLSRFHVWMSDRHLPGRRGKSHLQRGISTFAAGSREQWGAENITGKSQRWTKIEGNDMLWVLIFSSRKWKKWCFSMFFVHPKPFGLQSCTIDFWIFDTQQEAVEVGLVDWWVRFLSNGWVALDVHLHEDILTWTKESTQFVMKWCGEKNGTNLSGSLQINLTFWFATDSL